MLNAPLILMFIALTAVIIYMLFLRRMAIVLPWEYKHNVTIIRPYADMGLSVHQDQVKQRCLTSLEDWITQPKAT